MTFETQLRVVRIERTKRSSLQTSGSDINGTNLGPYHHDGMTFEKVCIYEGSLPLAAGARK